MNPIDELLDVMRQLRDPAAGCAWDVEQTFATIAPFTIEEAYEVAYAIERNDLGDLKDELGDLLLQVVFHAQMAAENGDFDFDDVCRAITDKMVRRHPHVFVDANYSSTQELKVAWEAEKARERQARAASDTSALDGIAQSLPALMRADKQQKRAARVGFDWPEAEAVFDKLQEEITEVRDAVSSGSEDAIEAEIGDLLFTSVNLARHYHVDSETALRRASVKFEKRFRQVEALAASRKLELSRLDLAALDELWEQAKMDVQ